MSSTLNCDASENALRFDAALLDRAVDSADPALLALVDRHARELLAAHPPVETLRDRVRAAVADALRRREVPGIEEVARAVGTSVRSLQRHLSDQRTSFSGEVDLVRRDLALRHVTERRLALCEIGFLLGYSEPRAFHRAFRRWTGTSPAQYRRSVA